MFVLMACSSLSNKAFGDKFSSEGVEDIKKDKQWSEWLYKYIKNVLYVDMPTDEFVRLFTKDASWSDSERPYIISHKDNKYIVAGVNGTKFRLTFNNGLLEKLEEYGWEKFIPHYGDISIYLKGYKNNYDQGFYDGMPEQEFLTMFSGSILSHSKDRYVVVGKNGKKYQVIFKNGYLNGYK